jgi:hypothetical protein
MIDALIERGIRIPIKNTITKIKRGIGEMKKLIFFVAMLSMMTFATAAFAIPVKVSATHTGTNDSHYYTDYYTDVWLDNTLGTSLGNFKAFCTDPADIPHGTVDTYELVSLPPAGINDSQAYNKAAWLMDRFLTTQGASVTDYQQAIWAIVFYSYGEALYSYIDTTTGSVHNLIDLANANGNFNASNYALLKSPRIGTFFDVVSQDYIIKYRVPEPTTLLLLGAGLVFLGGLRRKF